MRERGDEGGREGGKDIDRILFWENCDMDNIKCHRWGVDSVHWTRKVLDCLIDSEVEGMVHAAGKTLNLTSSAFHFCSPLSSISLSFLSSLFLSLQVQDVLLPIRGGADGVRPSQGVRFCNSTVHEDPDGALQ